MGYSQSPLPSPKNSCSRPATEPIEVRELRISQAASLADLREEYRFYTPAILYMTVPLGSRDPLADFTEETGVELHPVALRFDQPVFRGLTLPGNEEWNHVLFGLPPDEYEALLPWLASLTFVDRDRKYVARVRYRDLQIDDPLWKHRNPAAEGPVPKVSVTAFALDTNQGCLWLQPRIDGVPGLVHTSEVYPDTAKFAEIVLRGSDNPLLESESEEEVEQELQRRWREENDDAEG